MIDGRAKQRAALQTTRKLSRQLLHPIDRRRLRHIFTQHVEVLVQDRTLISERRLEDFAPVHRIFDLPEYPRVRHRTATNQHTIATRFTKLLKRSLDGRHIATTRNRHLHDFFDLPHEIPIRQPAVPLLLRTTVQRDVLSATILGELRRLNRINRVIVETGTDLHRQRNRDHFLDLFENRFEPAVILQQSRTTTMLHDLRRWTTTVNVEYVSANFLGYLRRHRHALRLTPKDLHRKWALVFVKTHLPFRLRVVARQTLNRNELRHRQTNTAATFEQTAEGHIGHSRHRRQNQRRIDLDVANFEWLSQLGLFAFLVALFRGLRGCRRFELQQWVDAR